MTIPADAAGKQGMTADAAEKQGMTADAAENREIMIPAWREVLVPSLLPEVHAGVKKKNNI